MVFAITETENGASIASRSAAASAVAVAGIVEHALHRGGDRRRFAGRHKAREAGPKISGMPPTRVAIIGSPAAMPSRTI